LPLSLYLPSFPSSLPPYSSINYSFHYFFFFALILDLRFRYFVTLNKVISASSFDIWMDSCIETAFIYYFNCSATYH
jgi:hypothetical protein